VLSAVASAQTGSVPAITAVPEQAAKFVNSGWSRDESILAKAIFIRAQGLEKRTGLHFDTNWKPRVSLEWGLGSGNGFDGIYQPETQTIYLPIHLIYDLTVRLKLVSGILEADTAARDTELAELFDHELGHELMDQVSRRNGLGPWFTEQRFNTSTRAEKLGLDILSEGTARFFERVNFPRDDSRLSEEAFPSTREEQRLYTYDMIAYDGGYWLVRDILHRYGERGLVWMMRHPFIADDDMRTAAVAYRRQALEELSANNGAL
jgi:hypothetical protein